MIVSFSSNFISAFTKELMISVWNILSLSITQFFRIFLSILYLICPFCFKRTSFSRIKYLKYLWNYKRNISFFEGLIYRSHSFSMMNLKVLFHWFYERISNYNTFIPNENEYQDDDGPRDLPTVLKHQKYSTWLYVFLLMGKYDVCFFSCSTLFLQKMIKTS